MLIIGITGTIGAGKGAIVDHLKNKYSLIHYSGRDFIVAEVIKRGLPVNRDTTTPVANDLRSKFGPAYIVEELYRAAKEAGKDAIIESVRTLGEIESLRKTGNFYLFAVDADPKLRYERVVLRKSSTDDISFEKFLADEEREMHSDDPNKQNLSVCIKNADYAFQNSGTLEELHSQIDEVMKKISG
jgi:dephospho-CoA kinase